MGKRPEKRRKLEIGVNGKRASTQSGPKSLGNSGETPSKPFEGRKNERYGRKGDMNEHCPRGEEKKTHGVQKRQEVWSSPKYKGEKRRKKGTNAKHR